MTERSQNMGDLFRELDALRQGQIELEKRLDQVDIRHKDHVKGVERRWRPLSDALYRLDSVGATGSIWHIGRAYQGKSKLKVPPAPEYLVRLRKYNVVPKARPYLWARAWTKSAEKSEGGP